jgi:glycosyltransferase involved in cell wall biosynthesis
LQRDIIKGEDSRYSVEIALVTEGTYPFHLGGVAVWCDQLMRGLPQHSFRTIAIGGDGMENVIWDAPPNMTDLETLFLWGQKPARKHASAALETRFEEAHARFAHALMRPNSAVQDFLEALRGLHAYALEADLETAMTSNAALERLGLAWREAQHERRRATIRPRDAHVEINLAEVLAASRLIAHLLRPLSMPAPQVQVVHAVSNGLAVLPAFTAKWAFGTPFVLTEHGVYLRERYLSYTAATYPYAVRALALNFYRLLSSAAYSIADRIVPGSLSNQRWELRGGADTSRIRTVYNGIDPSDFSETKLEPPEPTISWLGRIDPLKDLETLIRAFALVRMELPTARLRLFGPVPAGNEAYLERCEALIEELRLEGSAHFEGRVEFSLLAYHSGHVFVMTSISEGFPYSLIEAMACGCAVVATDVGGVGEAIGEAGLTVPPRDHAAVAQACLALLRDDVLRKKLGGAGRIRVQQQFTLDKCLSAYREIYDQALNVKPWTPEVGVGRVRPTALRVG